MAFDLGTASGTIRLNYAGGAAKAAIADATGIDRSFSKAGGTLARFSKIAGVGLGAALVGGLAVAVKTAASFEKQMSAVAAVSGATENQMDSLRNKALQLGADTAFSANEAGLAMEELVKAGLTIPEVLNGAADATVNLAAAAGIELPEAATISANAMNQFNLSAKDMTAVVDDIAGVANTSAIDVTQFGQSLKQVGAVSNVVGLSFEDTATAIGLMGDAGIVGSDAGTSLKTMLLNLQPTTEKQTALFKELGLITKEGANAFFDAEGNVKSLAGIAGVLSEALKGQTRQQKLANLETLFGTDAIRAAAIVANNGAKGVERFAEGMNKVSAADVAAERLDNFEGSVEQLKGSLETLLILIGTPLLGPLRSLVDLATQGANALGDMASGAEEPPEALQVLASIAQDLLTTLRNLWDVVSQGGDEFQGLATGGLVVVVGLLKTLSSLLATVSGAFDGMGGTLLVAGAAWLLLGGRLTAVMTQLKLIPTAAGVAALSLRDAATRAQTLGTLAKGAAGVAGMGALLFSTQQSSGALKTFTGVAGGAMLGFATGGPWGAAIGAGVGLLTSLTGGTNEASAAQKNFARAQADSKAKVDALTASLNQQSGAMSRQTRVEMAKWLSENEDAQVLMSQTGVDLRTLTQAHLGNEKAIRAVLAITRAYNKSVGGMGFNVKALAEDLRGANTPIERQAALIRASVAASKGWKQSTANLDELIRAAQQGRIDFQQYSQTIASIPKAARTEILGLGLDATRQDVLDLTKKYDGIDGRDVRSLIQALGLDDAINKTNQLDSNLNSLDGKTSTSYVTTIYQSRFDKVSAQLNQADGNILSFGHGGYAAGVYNGTRIKFAEAGMEAYIPMRPDKRDRAEKILAFVAKSFGGQFVKLAEGGLMNMAQGALTGAPLFREPAVVREVKEIRERGKQVNVTINNPEAERSSMSLINTLTTLGHTGHL